MADNTWAETRENATLEYGEPPGTEIERRILNVYQHRPSIVLEGIDHVGGRYKQGLVRSFWAVLALHVERVKPAVAKTALHQPSTVRKASPAPNNGFVRQASTSTSQPRSWTSSSTAAASYAPMPMTRFCSNACSPSGWNNAQQVNASKPTCSNERNTGRKPPAKCGCPATSPAPPSTPTTHSPSNG